jgi:hypothetical protein
MGNLSAPSETLEAWTGAPYLDGWPVEITGVIPSSPVLADLDLDGDLEVILGAKDQYVHVWHHDGTAADGWPNKTGGEVWSSAAVANLDADPELELVIGSNDGVLYAWNYDGTGYTSGDGYFKQLGGSVKGAPTIDDIDGDLDFEIVAANSYGQVYCWHHDGTGYLQGNGMFAQGSGNMTGSPTIADLDDNGDIEIIIGSNGGDIYVWNHDGTGFLNPDGVFASPGGIYGSLAVGDIDDNGDMEIVMTGRYWNGIAAYDHDGTYASGWPRPLDFGPYASPALADLDGDGRLSIIFGTFSNENMDTSSMYIFDCYGSKRTGWPIEIEGDFFSSAAVGDINGDGEPDIVVGSTNGLFYAWDKDGAPIQGWPRDIVYSFYSSPTIDDMENDGDLDIVTGGYDGKVYAFDVGAPYDQDEMEWPKMCHDNFNSGLYNGPSKAGIPGRDGKHLPRELVLSSYPNPAFAAVSIRLGIPASKGSDRINVDVYDIQGRHVKQVCDAALEPGYHDLAWNGKDKHSKQVASGIYFIQVSLKGESKSRKIVLVR